MGVLLISSGLIVGLLQEARAITMTFTSDASTSFSGSTDFTVDIKIPNGQRVPLTDVAAIVEKARSGTSDKSGVTTVTRAVCAMTVLSSGNCPDNGAFKLKTGSLSTVVSKIAFVAAYKDSVSSSNVLSNASTFFASGTLSGTRTGYGYDTVSPNFTKGLGFGYGYDLNGQTSFSAGTGLGYGYTGATLILRFTVTVNPATLSADTTYYLTVVGITGSSVIGDLSTKFHQFSKASAISGGGGGGGGGTTTAGTGSGETQTLAATQITTPTGAKSAWQVTITTAAAGNTVVITTGDATFPQFTLKVSKALSNAVATLINWGTTVPPGAASLPSGVTGFNFFEITVTNAEGSIEKVIVAVKLPAADVPDAAKGVLLRLENGVWVPKSRLMLTLANNFYTGNPESPCCSVFAYGFDLVKPTVTLTAPSGTLSGTQKFTATAADNLQVAKVDFYVDDVLKSSDTVSPYEFNFDTTQASNGQHTVKAVAVDYVDNSAEDSEPVSVQNEVAPTPTKAPGGKVSTTVWIILGLVLLAVIVVAVVLANRKPKGGKGGK